MNPLTQSKTATILPVLIALTLCGFSVSADAQCVTPPDDLVHWWTADGDTFDIIGGEQGILRNGATFGTGEVAQAFSLDGTDDFVEVPNDPAAAFNFTGAFTIDAWIFLDAYSPEFSPIVSKWNDIPFGNENRAYSLAIDVNQTAQPRLRFDVSRDGHFLGTSSARTLSKTTIPTGQWLHVAGVFDPAQSTVTQRLKVYVNGVNVSGGFFIPSQVTSVFVNQEPLLIGAGDLGSNVRDFFDGRIDEVELFDRALSQSEIQAIVNAGSAGKCKPGDELTLDSAASVKGLFAIDLPLNGLSGVEDRGGSRNGRYLIVMTFNNEITSASNATVSCGPDATATATIDPADAHNVNVSLVGVNKRCSESDVVITADVSNGTDSITASVTMGLLIGDVNGDRVVDQSDVQLARSYRGQTTDGTNFRTDINDNGRIESSDVGLVKENQGDSL